MAEGINDIHDNDIPSGFIINDSDKVDFTFSDITVINRSEATFVAKGMRFGKWFTFKGLNPEYVRLDPYVSMLRKEFELLIGLEHPNIRKAYNFEDVPGYGPCLIMEYADGETLQKWLNSPRLLRDRLRIAFEIGKALDYIHTKGIVHRDIKPRNILITHVGKSAKIIDFGLSDSDEYYAFKYPGGTPNYISPEQEAGGKPDARNDIYSYGKVLLQLLPERRFRWIIKKCFRQIEKRPKDIEEVTQGLRRSNQYTLGLFFFFIILIGFIIAAFLFFFQTDNPGRSNQPEAEPQEITAPFEILEPTTAATPSGSEASEEVYSPGKDGNAIQKTVSDDNTVKNVGRNNSETEHDAAKKKSLNSGIQTLSMAWQTTALRFLDTVSANSPIPEKWDTRKIMAVKKNYMENLRYIRENSTASDINLLSEKDLDEIEKQLDKLIDEKQKEWIKIRNNRISKR